MNTKIDPKEVGEALMVLAELLSVEYAEMTAIELLNVLEGRAMSAEEAGDVAEYLTT